MKLWFRWESRAGVQQWDTCQDPTELLLNGYLTESIWTPKFKSGISTPSTRWQTYWQKEISQVMNGTIFFICLTSAISALSAVLRISAWPAAPERCRKWCKNRKEKTKSWRNPGQDDEHGRFCSYKFFICEQSDCVEKLGDTQSFKSTGWIIRETWCEHKSKLKFRRGVEFPRMAKGCSAVHKHRVTCSSRWGPEVSESSGENEHRGPCSTSIPRIIQKILKLQKIQKIRNPKVEFGHIISVYRQIMLITWRKSSRS